MTLNEALRYPDATWALRFVTKSMMDEMDEMLVNNKHPLAYEPGTQESRFRKLHSQKFQFTKE